MSLTLDQRIAAIGVSVGLLLPAFPALWKAAGLRGEINKNWASRVELTYAGLAECAIEALRELQAQANQLLGDMGDFDPSLAVADPAPLAALAMRFNRLLCVRKRIHSRLRRQLRLMILPVYLVGAYAAGVIMAGAYYVGIENVRWTGWAGIALASVALVGGGLVLIGYAYLENRLTTAEIMAGPAGPDSLNQGTS
jgi:hypothetical protein